MSVINRTRIKLSAVKRNPAGQAQLLLNSQSFQEIDEQISLKLCAQRATNAVTISCQAGLKQAHDIVS